MGITGWLAILLTAAHSQPAPQSLEQTLQGLVASERRVDDASQDLARCVNAWQSISSLPESEQPAWQRALAAVLMSADASRGDAQDPRSSPRGSVRREQSLLYLRALAKAAGAEDVPPAVTHLVRSALAEVAAAAGRDLPPAERQPLMDEAYGYNREAATFWKAYPDIALEAWCRANLAMDLFAGGRLDEARRTREESIRLFEKLPEDFLKPAEVNLETGEASPLVRWQEEGHQRQAEVYLLSALDQYNEGLDSADQARESVFLFAESLRLGMVHRSVTAINNVSALLIRAGIGEETGRIRKIEYLLRVLEILPDARANPHWRGRGALAQLDQAVRWIHARVHAYLGDFYAQSGRVLLARFHLDRAEELATELDDTAILPLALEARAALWLRLGSTANCLREARRILDVDGSLHQRADALLLMGAVFDRECDYQRAKDCYRWAKDLFVKPGQFTLNRSDVLALSRVREQMGRLEFAHGQFGPALDALREAASLAALEDLKQSAALQIERLQIVQWLSAEGRYRPSSGLLAALRNQSQPQSLAAIVGRGPVVARPGRTPAAGHSHDHDSPALSAEQVRLLEGLLQEPSAARSAQPDTGEVQSPSAREIIAECRQALDKLESRSHDSSTGTTLGAQLAAARGELETASGLFQNQLETAWKAFARELDPALAIESTESFRRLHHDAAVVEARSGRPAAALSILDMGRSRTMLAAASGTRDFWQQLAPEDRRVAAQLDDARTALKQRMTELAAQAAGRPDMVQPLRAVASERQRLEAQWQTFVANTRASQGHGEPALTKPLDEAQIGELLDVGQALLAWSVGPYETCAVLARRTTAGLTFVTRLLPIRQEELEGLAGAWRAGLVASGLNHDLLGRELYDLLIRPLAGELADVKLLAILPDGPLNSLPFAALPDSQGGYLLERTAVVSVPSLALLTRLRRAGAPVGEGLLVVDVQRFDEVHYVPSVYQIEESAGQFAGLLPALRLPPLEGTRVEAAGLIRRAGPQASRLSDADAREDRVRAAAGGKRILHFATHGLADPYDPLLSALVLAPSRADGSDGFLEAAEVMADERLSGADLVTLSACETAVGMTHGSEGVLGLTWAFLAAGNRTVLASLWPVDDVATAFLMDRFYQNLLGQRTGLESPMPKAEALMEAGQWLRNLTLDEATRLAAGLSQGASRGKNEPALALTVPPADARPTTDADNRPFAHPRYWAAFILIGDPE